MKKIPRHLPEKITSVARAHDLTAELIFGALVVAVLVRWATS